MKRYVLLLVAAFALAGCGGGGGSSATPAGGTAKTQAKTSSGMLVLSIPTGTSAASSKVRYPQFVSPAAQSVTLSINGGAAASFDVSTTSTLCTTVSGARNCTLSFVAPIGSDSFTFTIYSFSNAVLSTGTATATVVLGTPFSLTVAMNAVIGTLVTNFNPIAANCPNNASFNGIIEGCAASGTFTFTTMDPSGNTITGTAPYTQAIQISANDPSLTASPNSVTAPGQSVTGTYSGAAFAAGISSQVTVTLTVGTQTIPVAVPVKRQYLYVANSNSEPGVTPPGGGNIAVYTFGATGSATPARLISGAATGLSNPVDVKLDSSGNLYVLDNGPYTSNSNPYVVVFAPGATGNVAPIRTISGIAGIDYNTACETMVFDPTGQYLDIMCDDSSGTIHVVPASTNGPASSAQTASMIDDSSWHLVGMAYDATGNLYVTDTGYVSGGIVSPGTAGVLYFPAAQIVTGGGTFQLIAPTKAMTNSGTSFPSSNMPIGVVVDQQGTLYATVGYLNSTSGAPDSTNEIAIWKTTSIPCSSCAPNTTLTGTPFTAHTPAGGTLDAAGNAYVSNPFSNQIFVFAQATIAAGGANPTVLHTINTGSSPGAPIGMTVGP